MIGFHTIQQDPNRKHYHLVKFQKHYSRTNVFSLIFIQSQIDNEKVKFFWEDITLYHSMKDCIPPKYGREHRHFSIDLPPMVIMADKLLNENNQSILWAPFELVNGHMLHPVHFKSQRNLLMVGRTKSGSADFNAGGGLSWGEKYYSILNKRAKKVLLRSGLIENFPAMSKISEKKFYGLGFEASCSIKVKQCVFDGTSLNKRLTVFQLGNTGKYGLDMREANLGMYD